MMGKKKLSEIRTDIADEFSKTGVDAQQWFSSRIEKLQAKKQPDHREIEALRLLRDAIKKTDASESQVSKTADA